MSCHPSSFSFPNFTPLPPQPTEIGVSTGRACPGSSVPSTRLDSLAGKSYTDGSSISKHLASDRLRQHQFKLVFCFLTPGGQTCLRCQQEGEKEGTQGSNGRFPRVCQFSSYSEAFLSHRSSLHRAPCAGGRCTRRASSAEALKERERKMGVGEGKKLQNGAREMTGCWWRDFLTPRPQWPLVRLWLPTLPEQNSHSALAVLGFKSVPGHLLNTESGGSRMWPRNQPFHCNGVEAHSWGKAPFTPWHINKRSLVIVSFPFQLCPPRGDRQSDRFIQVCALIGTNDLMCCPF